jgi:hypothetical protein
MRTAPTQRALPGPEADEGRQHTGPGAAACWLLLEHVPCERDRGGDGPTSQAVCSEAGCRLAHASTRALCDSELMMT